MYPNEAEAVKRSLAEDQQNGGGTTLEGSVRRTRYSSCSDPGQKIPQPFDILGSPCAAGDRFPQVAAQLGLMRYWKTTHTDLTSL